jgi:NAD-dependent deacetylase
MGASVGQDLQESLERGRKLLRRAKRITVFTGAGVSAESGVPTFRDAGGFWTRFPPEEFAHWRGLGEKIQQEPLRAAEFVGELLRPVLAAKPNPAHDAIARLEKQKQVVGVVTQNIDGLHQRAGSARVMELHGSIFETATVDKSPREIHRVPLDDLTAAVRDLSALVASGKAESAQFWHAARALFGTNSAGAYRPNLVLFGDTLPEDAWLASVDAVTYCDLLLIVGTSGLVYPAASLPRLAQEKGAKVVSVGFDRCECDVWLRGAAGELLPQLIAS